MAYCVNCGVELAKSELKCPLCGTPIPRPGCAAPVPKANQPLLPPNIKRQQTHIEKHSLLLLLSMLCLLPIILSYVCDVSLHGTIEWAGFVAVGCALLYLTIIIPVTLRPAMLIQLGIDFVASEGALFYIAHRVGGGWYWSFAFPIALYPFAAAAFLTLLRRGLHRDGLEIASLASLFTGIYCMLIEWRINVVFEIRTQFAWAQYPLLTLIALAALLFLVSRSKALKEKLARRFFI